jgi:phage terminase large subunit-like protein
MKEAGLAPAAYIAARLVEWIVHTCRRFGGADMLLIEEKASGIEVVNEMKRLYGNETWAIEGIVPTHDKVSRICRSSRCSARAWFLPRRATGATWSRARWPCFLRADTRI